MELKIVVNDNLFSDIVEKELYAIPKEKLQELLVSGIKEYMEGNEFKTTINKLFFERSYYNSEPVLSEIGKKIINSALSENAFKDVEDSLLEIFKSEGSIILQKAMTEFFIRGILNSNYFKDEVSQTINYELQSAISRSQNNN